MHKKDLGLFVLILVVGGITAFLNPRFLSPVNLVNMANLIGLFGLFAIGKGLGLGAIHGFLITRLNMQPFVVTLCGLLIYRGLARWYMNDATIGFGYGDEFATLSWLASGKTFGIPHTFVTLVVVAVV